MKSKEIEIVKRKLVLMGIAGMLITTTIVGGTLAATAVRSQTGNTEAVITVDDLSIQLADSMVETDRFLVASDSSSGNSTGTIVVPNSTIEYSQCVQNTGSYPVYIRVTVLKQWQGDFAMEMEPDLSYITLNYNQNDWIAFLPQQSIMEREEVPNPLVLYYKYPVEVGGESSRFLNYIFLSPEIDQNYSNLQIAISVTAEAVQSLDGENSIPSEWGVFPIFSGTEITAINQ